MSDTHNDRDIKPRIPYTILSDLVAEEGTAWVGARSASAFVENLF